MMDMMEKKTYLSMEETEQLCRLYMECKLTRLEEAELQYVLGMLPYTSPVIEEVRTLMNLSLSYEGNSTDRLLVNTHVKKKIKMRRLMLSAASIALILSIGIPSFFHFTRKSDYYCQVFTNGKKVGRDKALIIAESEVERIDRFFENMRTIEYEQQQKTESF